VAQSVIVRDLRIVKSKVASHEHVTCALAKFIVGWYVCERGDVGVVSSVAAPSVQAGKAL
jgi:hypothetical protein